MKIPELVVPVGSPELLETALSAGADAVYLGPSHFSLRAGSGEFAFSDIAEAADDVHSRGKRIFLTLNRLFHDREIEGVLGFLDTLRGLPLDAVIVSDMGMLQAVRKTGLNVHLSTQASILNREAARFFETQGVKRIILARELSLAEIDAICHEVPAMEFEAFVHGAMCVSYSGRCLLSDYLTERRSNAGDCAQPCRWSYALRENGSGAELPVEEERGRTTLLNSRDLCALPLLPDLVASGLSALKIEGRNKGHHYLAIVTRVYRDALDTLHSPVLFKKKAAEWQALLESVSHRAYTTGFLADLAYSESLQAYGANAHYQREWRLIGLVREVREERFGAIEVRHDLDFSTPVSLFSPERGVYLKNSSLLSLADLSGTPISKAQTNHLVWMEFKERVSRGSLVRVPC